MIEKQFPTFLGIGTIKSGSTWLTQLLATHPEIYVPWQRSEIQFFNINFEKGREWYAQFFPNKKNTYKQVGEFTPRYMYDQQALIRIKEFGGIQKFIISFRNPVERAYSYYTWWKRNHPYDQRTFKEILDKNEEVIDFGFYAKHLKPLLENFERDSFCFFVFEDMVKEVDVTKKKLAEFLEVDPYAFPKDAGKNLVNQSFTPKNRLLFTIGVRLGKTLRSRDLYFIEKILRNPFVMNMVRKPGKKQKLTEEDIKLKKELYNVFKEDIEELKIMTGLNLKKWEIQKQELFNL